MPDSLYVSSLRFVATFSRDERIRFRLEEAELAFAGLIGEQLTSTNVPDTASPEIYRFVARAPGKVLTISQIAAEFRITGLSSDADFVQELRAMEETARKFWTATCKFKTSTERGYLGIVPIINVPLAIGAQEAVDRLSDRFLKIPAGIALSNANFSFSTSETTTGLNESCAVEIYQSDEPLPDDESAEHARDATYADLGYEVRFDVNTRLKTVTGMLTTDDEASLVLQRLIPTISEDRYHVLNW